MNSIVQSRLKWRPISNLLCGLQSLQGALRKVVETDYKSWLSLCCYDRSCPCGIDRLREWSSELAADGVDWVIDFDCALQRAAKSSIGSSSSMFCDLFSCAG